VSEEPEEMVHVEIPTRADGELDFEPVARSVLSYAWIKRAGASITVTNAWRDFDTFLGWYDGHGGIEVFKPCLGNQFGASIYMALERLSPSMVHVVEAVGQSSRDSQG